MRSSAPLLEEPRIDTLSQKVKATHESALFQNVTIWYFTFVKKSQFSAIALDERATYF
jgi:hypothetical protein